MLTRNGKEVVSKDMVNLYALENGDYNMIQPEIYKMEKFLDDNYFNVFTKGIENINKDMPKEKADIIKEKIDRQLSISGKSSLIANYILVKFIESDLYKKYSTSIKSFLEDLYGIDESTYYKHKDIIEKYGLDALRVVQEKYTNLNSVIPLLRDNSKISAKKIEEIREYFLKRVQSGATSRTIEEETKKLKQIVSEFNDTEYGPIAKKYLENTPIKSIIEDPEEPAVKYRRLLTPKQPPKSQFVANAVKYDDHSIDAFKPQTPKQKEADKMFTTTDYNISQEAQELTRETGPEVIVSNVDIWENLYNEIVIRTAPPTDNEAMKYVKKIYDALGRLING